MIEKRKRSYYAANISVHALVRKLGNTIPPRRVRVVGVAHVENSAICISNCFLVIPCTVQTIVGVLVTRANVQRQVGESAILNAEVRASAVSPKGLRVPHSRPPHVAAVGISYFVPVTTWTEIRSWRDQSFW
jgi:hypothetical protein